MHTHSHVLGKKVGIIGGGQLGKMLVQSASKWNLPCKILAPARDAGHAHGSEVIMGDILDFETVFNFGKDCDVVTVEIEHVNTEALYALEKLGITVHPNPQSLELINDKGEQKSFFKQYSYPTASFTLCNGKEEVLERIKAGSIRLPFIQKSRKGGYDGKGVQAIYSESDFGKLMDTPCVIEDIVPIEKEISVIAARNAQGDVVCYDPVEMSFVKNEHLLDMLSYPADISEKLKKSMQIVACGIIEKLSLCGLLAVEFFVDTAGQILVNELAPRPHNSGHQTIESSETSQYEQHLRGILNLPLGGTKTIIPSVMLNLLGEDGYEGDVYYEHLDDCLKLAGVHLHIYGKNKTKPRRKMGHITVTNKHLNEAKKLATWIKQRVKVKSL